MDYRRPSRRATTSFVARGCSAVGSASPCQGEGRGFESRHPLEGAVASTPAVEWPSGEATACKAVHTGSIPVSTSNEVPGAISSAGERFPDTEEVTGSIPVSRTSVCAVQSMFLKISDTCCGLNVGYCFPNTPLVAEFHWFASHRTLPVYDAPRDEASAPDARGRRSRPKRSDGRVWSAEVRSRTV